MIVALSGSSGFIGQNLLPVFRRKDYTVKLIERASFALSDYEFRNKFIEGTDVVIHLAGAPVARKWTPAYKQEILSSRVEPTRKISEAIASAENKPKLFISASAIGIYDDRQTHTEESTAFAANFLYKVCRAWEDEAEKAAPHTRLVILRIGVVLGRHGGMLERVERTFSLGLGGKLGSGEQFMSFIHIHDLAEAILFVIGNEDIEGVVNAVSPYPSYNAEFTNKLGRVLGQQAFLTVPAFVLKLMLGEGAAVVLEGQRVLPEKLTRAGFKFRYPTIQNALLEVFSR